MTRARYRRLTAYAAYAALYLLVAILGLAGLLGEDSGVIVAIASLPLLLAWFAYQTDLVVNAGLSAASRNRWRIALFVVPLAIVAYWWLEVRPRWPGDF